MQTCLHCGKELHCGCQPSSSHGGAVLPCQQKKGSVWVHITDEHGTELPDFPVTCSGRSPEKTDAFGVAKFELLDAAPYTVTLGALPRALADTHLLPETKTRNVVVSDNTVAYTAFEVHSVFGTLLVRVVDRESGKAIPNITFPIKVTGLEPKETDNNALLALQLPPKTYTSIAVEPDREEWKRYFRPGDPGKATIKPNEVTEVTLPVDVRKLLRLQLFDAHRPRANEPYTLTVSGSDHSQPGTTTDKGILEQYIDYWAVSATLVIGPEKQEIQLTFVDLPPATEEGGCYQRLRNLGYETGPSGSGVTPELGQALRDFQRDHKLTISGALDSPTKERLALVHDQLYSYPEPSH